MTPINPRRVERMLEQLAKELTRAVVEASLRSIGPQTQAQLERAFYQAVSGQTELTRDLVETFLATLPATRLAE